MTSTKRLPKVSILIPVYNREKLILQTLHSAVSQTYLNTEVIVVDNRSTDNTYKVIKAFSKIYPNVKVYQNNENIGPVRNWRRCLDYATGEYVKILWSDDLISSNFIQETLPSLVNYKDVAFVCTGVKIFSNDVKQEREIYFSETGGI